MRAVNQITFLHSSALAEEEQSNQKHKHATIGLCIVVGMIKKICVYPLGIARTQRYVEAFPLHLAVHTSEQMNTTISGTADSSSWYLKFINLIKFLTHAGRALGLPTGDVLQSVTGN